MLVRRSLLVACFLLVACKPAAPLGVAGTQLESGGAPFEITEEGHPYRGLKLTLPAETFAEKTEWLIELAPEAELPALPPGFELGGPALSVQTDAARGDQLMTLEVPFARVEGSARLLALIDPSRGVIEVLPTISETDTTVTVATAHLKPDLLMGRGTGELQQPLVSGLLPLGELKALLQPILMPTPVQPVGPVVDLSLFRWPVIDHGSAAFPDGHGEAIAGYQALGAAMSASPWASLVKPTQTPGFYAEPAPLGALVLAQRQTGQAVREAAAALDRALGAKPKAERDALVHLNVLANLNLNGGIPAALALFSESGAELAPVNAVGASESSMTLFTAGAIQSATMSVSAGTGYVPLAISRLGDGPSTLVTRAVPMPSFVYPFEKIKAFATRLQGLADPAQRKEISKELSEQAQLPGFEVELRIDNTSEWVPTEEDLLVLRDFASELRVGAGKAIVHNEAGAELNRMTSEAVSATLMALGGSVPVDRSFSLYAEETGGRIRQASVKVLEAVKAPVEATPETANVDASSLEVKFEAKFEFPPASGFRLEWDWGDGKKSEALGLLAASHLYEKPGDYDVKLTLTRAVNGLHKLGTKLIKVTSGQAPYWRIDTFADADGLYANRGVNGEPDPFQRMLAAPRAGLIAVGPNNQLDLKVALNALWDPTAALPPAVMGTVLTWSLGTSPATPNAIGPYFSAFSSNSWSQSSTDLSTGSMTAQAILGVLSYNIPDVGTQPGPAGALRLTATRNGVSMTGVFTATIWFVDGDTGMLDEVKNYSFPFSATRMR